MIDSLGASFGFGLLLFWPGQISKKKKTLLKLFQDNRNQKQDAFCFTIDTLEYLVKGGRVSKTAGFVAGLLDVKPILHINTEGKIDVFGKVRSRKSAIRKLIEIMEQDIVDPESQIIGISHSACPEDALFFAEEIKNKLKVKDILLSEIGCVIGSHVGPGTLALFYQSEIRGQE